MGDETLSRDIRSVVEECEQEVDGLGRQPLRVQGNGGHRGREVGVRRVLGDRGDEKVGGHVHDAGSQSQRRSAEPFAATQSLARATDPHGRHADCCQAGRRGDSPG